MNYQTILFDLDGTLTDPALGITNSVMAALDKFGIQVSERSELYTFIGPPLVESFEKYFGFSEAQAKKALEYYREYFRDRGIFENVVYDGLEDLLEYLRASGRTLLVATSKPAVFARRILEHFNLSRFFAFVSGSELDGTRINKDEVIRYALDTCGITKLQECVMVGDREHDIFGAKKAGVASIGVLYGYGSREELQGAGADFIASSIAELKAMFERADKRGDGERV